MRLIKEKKRKAWLGKESNGLLKMVTPRKRRLVLPRLFVWVCVREIAAMHLQAWQQMEEMFPTLSHEAIVWSNMKRMRRDRVKRGLTDVNVFLWSWSEEGWWNSSSSAWRQCKKSTSSFDLDTRKGRSHTDSTLRLILETMLSGWDMPNSISVRILT